MEKEAKIKLAGAFFNIINDGIIHINKLFKTQKEYYQRRRRILINNIANLRRQQMLLIIACHDSCFEKRVWKMDRTQSFWEIDCTLFSDDKFKQNFRMTRETFQLLCSKMECMTRENTTFRDAIPLQKRVAIAVYALGSSAEYRSVGNLFGVGKSTVCEILLEFCTKVWDVLSPEYLCNFPLTKNKIEECVKGFEKLGFPQCLGAIDGYHIEIHPSEGDTTDYRNYKGWYSNVLFALVDYRYRFIYINVGSPGRSNDSKIFEESNLKKYLTRCPLLDEMSKTISGVDVPVLIIGDSAFRLSKYVMKPYPFQVDEDLIKKNFNYFLSKSRRVVENGFGHLKGRFRRIGKGIDNRVVNSNSIIKACCVLHNFLNEHSDDINSQWLMESQTTLDNSQNQPQSFLMTENSGETIRDAIAVYLGVGVGGNEEFVEGGDGEGDGYGEEREFEDDGNTFGDDGSEFSSV